MEIENINKTNSNNYIESEKRREFLKKGSFLLGAGFALPTLSTLMMSCESDEIAPKIEGTAEIRLSDYTDLLKTDGTGISKVTAKTPSASVNVIVRRLSSDEFIVVQSNCTHQGDQELPPPTTPDGDIICPRHQAQYSLQKATPGKLVKNPNNVSASDLKVYKYTYSNGILIIDFKS